MSARVVLLAGDGPGRVVAIAPTLSESSAEIAGKPLRLPCPSESSIGMLDIKPVVSEWMLDKPSARKDAARKLAATFDEKCDTECAGETGKTCPDPYVMWDNADVDEKYETKVDPAGNVLRRCRLVPRNAGVAFHRIFGKVVIGMQLGGKITLQCVCGKPAKKS